MRSSARHEADSLVAIAFLLAVVAAAVGCASWPGRGRSSCSASWFPESSIVGTVVALTFDDGPTAASGRRDHRRAGHTPRPRDILRDGRELAAAPDAGRRLVAAGHELGNHTYSHAGWCSGRLDSFGTRSSGPTRSFERLVSQVQIYFRPPFCYKLVGPSLVSGTNRPDLRDLGCRTGLLSRRRRQRTGHCQPRRGTCATWLHRAAPHLARQPAYVAGGHSDDRRRVTGEGLPVRDRERARQNG